MNPRPVSLAAQLRARPILACIALLLLAGLAVAACAPKPPVTTAPQLLAPPADPCVLAREDAARDPRRDGERIRHGRRGGS